MKCSLQMRSVPCPSPISFHGACCMPLVPGMMVPEDFQTDYCTRSVGSAVHRLMSGREQSMALCRGCCIAADEKTEKKYEMANVDSKMRSVHTTSRTRVMWGIGIAIVGGTCTLLTRASVTECAVSLARS